MGRLSCPYCALQQRQVGGKKVCIGAIAHRHKHDRVLVAQFRQCTLEPFIGVTPILLLEVGQQKHRLVDARRLFRELLDIANQFVRAPGEVGDLHFFDRLSHQVMVGKIPAKNGLGLLRTFGQRHPMALGQFSDDRICLVACRIEAGPRSLLGRHGIRRINHHQRVPAVTQQRHRAFLESHTRQGQHEKHKHQHPQHQQQQVFQAQPFLLLLDDLLEKLHRRPFHLFHLMAVTQIDDDRDTDQSQAAQ